MFRVHDKGKRVAKELHNFSPRNPRYAIVDRHGNIVDEFVTKRAAEMEVHFLNGTN